MFLVEIGHSDGMYPSPGLKSLMNDISTMLWTGTRLDLYKGQCKGAFILQVGNV